MPFKIVDEQRKFKWSLSAELPIGECEQWGSALYCLCCPLCGMLHEIRGATADAVGEYQPHCIVKTTHKATYAEWLKKHPESADYSRVWLMMRRPIQIVPFAAEKSPETALQPESEAA